MDIYKDSTVGHVATEFPMATKVFSRHNIDFCCGGGLRLEDACEKKGLVVNDVLKEIEIELSNTTFSEIKWTQAPLNDLIEHLLAVYHRPLDEELPRLEMMAKKVLTVHREKGPVMLSELVSVYSALKMELQEHMGKEEQILFPMIKQGQGAFAGGPISVMQHEHDSAGAALQRLRELTDDYKVPEYACNTWGALWDGLEALEESLHQHIHLENNILFPRALAS